MIFCDGGTCTCVWCARACVRESVRAFVCYCQDAVTKIHKPIFVNIQPS